MNKIIFITGGARSGKSRAAEELSLLLNKKRKKKIAYLATAEITDSEMKERVRLHIERRENDFTTYEEALFIDKKIEEIQEYHDIIIIECLTTWLGNIFYKKEGEAHDFSFMTLKKSIEAFKKSPVKTENKIFAKKLKFSEKRNFKEKLSSLIKKGFNGKILIIISNEVNMGIVPDNKLSRDYRDLLGKINQFTADNSDFVFFTVSGQLLRIK